jgi:hyperosmotically inducible periplasmic protein
MLTRFTTAAAVVLGLGLFGSPTSASAAGPEHLQVFRAVQRQVLNYVYFTIFDNVEAQIDNGVVTLTGKVTMPFKSTDIAKRVARVEGVTAVRNRIQALPVSQFDDDLRVRLARAIYGHSNFIGYGSQANPPIHIIVDRGRVTLEGVVNSEVDRMLARSIAGSFLAFEVKNELKTTAEAREELERL